jgi:hypothetical protein
MKVQFVVSTKNRQLLVDPVGDICNMAHVLGRAAQGMKVGLYLGVAEVKSGVVTNSSLTKEQKRIVIESAIKATLKLL